MLARRGWSGGPCQEVYGRNLMMYEHGKSDRFVVPEKTPNKAGSPVAEGLEGKDLAKGNSLQQSASRAQYRNDVCSALGRVRQVAASSFGV